MQYIFICNKCGKQFSHSNARFYCDDCKILAKENSAKKGIELLLKEGGYKDADIAKKFNVSKSYVSLVKKELGLIKQYKELL